jgi:hypothetical protein
MPGGLRDCLKGKNIQTRTEFRVSAWKRTRILQRVMIIFSNTKRAETFR